jgi:hypothetical protein
MVDYIINHFEIDVLDKKRNLKFRSLKAPLGVWG